AYSYDSYDVTPHLKPGQRNVVAALVNYLGDHSMGYIRGNHGFLCELILESSDGNLQRIGSDSSWRTLGCMLFNNDAPRISLQLEFEEQVDARCEVPNWAEVDFDDSSWQQATEIGPIGCAPWTTLVPRTIPFLTEDPVLPVQIKAVELARPRPGHIWSVDLREYTRMMRTGLRSAPPGERGSITFTEIVTPRDCTVLLHQFPDYETIDIRFKDQYFIRGNVLDYGAKPIELALKQGANLFMLRTVDWPSLLFETTEAISFSAERFVPGAEWVIVAPLNEITDELEAYWKAPDLDSLPSGARRYAIPASANKTDIFALTTSQLFYAVEGGFCTHDITRATPRPKLSGKRPNLVTNPNALLHDNNDWTTVYPQPDGDVHIVVDFGREMIGYIKLDIDAAAGSIIDGNFFEGIDDTGIFWTRNLRNTFRYTCREGRQVFTSHYRRGFRFGSFTFRNLKRPLRIRHIQNLLSTYPVEAQGRFACSDETLAKIWHVGAYTVQLCMLDTYVDCPAYEQVFWVGDARNSALVNAVAFGAYDLTDRCVRLTGASLADELKLVIPPYLQAMRTHITTSHTVSGWFDEIPMWTFLWIWMAWEQYWNTGDARALADYYADVKECLRRCAMFLTDRDLFDIPDVWNLVDWAAQDLERDGEVISNTVLMAQSLDLAANMAEILGHADEAVQHAALAKRLRDAVNQYGWSDKYQGYVDTVRDEYAYRRHKLLCAQRSVKAETFDAFQAKQRISEPTNTLALLCDAVPKERRDAVMKFVLAAKEGKFIGSSPWMAQFGNPDQVVPVGSPWFLFFTLQTLFEENLASDALQILREQWNKILEKGATTFWETFPGLLSEHWSRSLCHGWSAAPAYFLSTQVLGVQPTAAGYRRIRIAPQPFNLRWASGSVPTPLGLVTVDWRINESGRMEIAYSAPEGCDVEVVEPAAVAGGVTS
ncbi:MAG TPA: family 78 glycoside hydrolase catalytic domain, partial [Aggregatilineales bacterium]|nr:family 78 glycoside hydrolase catalytic domain [Aggregatilineales bacterium]